MCVLEKLELLITHFNQSVFLYRSQDLEVRFPERGAFHSLSEKAVPSVVKRPTWSCQGVGCQGSNNLVSLASHQNDMFTPP